MLTFTLPAVVHVYVFANVFVLPVPNGPVFFSNSLPFTNE